jgi:hypothetical protein
MNNTATLPAFRSLSQEHRQGLDFVSRLRNGIEQHICVERLRTYVLWYWTEHIKPHFYQEERILLPMMKGDEQMFKRIKDEHEYIRELILEIDMGPERREFVILADLIEDHILFEETRVFPHLQRSTDPFLIREIELKMNPPKEKNWKDPFWKTI